MDDTSHLIPTFCPTSSPLLAFSSLSSASLTDASLCADWTTTETAAPAGMECRCPSAPEPGAPTLCPVRTTKLNLSMIGYCCSPASCYSIPRVRSISCAPGLCSPFLTSYSHLYRSPAPSLANYRLRHWAFIHVLLAVFVYALLYVQHSSRIAEVESKRTWIQRCLVF